MASARTYLSRDPEVTVSTFDDLPYIYLDTSMFQLALSPQGWAVVLPAVAAMLPDEERAQVLAAITERLDA
jgi:hypothetical protein